MKCTRCGSHAINEHLHGREKGKNLDLCDVCYWRKKAETLLKKNDKLTNQMLEKYTYDDLKEHGHRLINRCIEIAREHNSIEGVAEQIEAEIRKEFEL